MKYRDAKLLKLGDAVYPKDSELSFLVRNIEVYGQIKMIRVNCCTESGDNVSWFHTELKNFNEFK